jgi:predicted ribosomally synthesized peptide with SipW-like signal peptide
MKKKIFVIAVVACILSLSIVGTSLAYFTDTEKYTNVFTAGNVEIKLTESVVAEDGLGNLVATAKTTTIDDVDARKDYGEIFPSQTIAKNPTIVNIGSENAYVGAIISIESTEFNTIVADYAIDEFITGLSSYATVTYTKTTNGYTLYMIFNDAIATGGSYTLFTGIKVFDNWDNTEMANLKKLKIVVNAYATQVSGFADAKTAITTAFAAKGWDALSSTAIPANPANP